MAVRVYVRVTALASVLGAIGCGFGAAASPGALVADSCGAVAVDDAHCARLTVLENRSKPDGRTIRLRIVVLPALGGDGSQEPIFFLAGGPGQAASELLRDPSYRQSSLRARRDLVFVDQRGTGESHALNCRFYGRGEAQNYFTEFLPLAKVRECRAELERRADLAQYTTAASVDDLEEARAALGYERINLIGGSYGTRLAMEYVRRYEARVRAVVLAGPVPPSLRAPEAFGRHAQRSLDALLADCAASRECATAFPELRVRAGTVFERLRHGPVTATVAHPADRRSVEVTLTRDHVAEAIRYMMYSSRDAGAVPLYLHEAAKGNFSPIAQYLLDWRADGMFDGLYLAVTCAEDVPFVSADAADRDADTYLGRYRVLQQRAACAEWPRGTVPQSHGTAVAATVPVLILSGMLDPVTPPELGDEVARTLPNSLHVRVPYGGHSFGGLNGVDCLTRLRADFIERASVEGLETGCVAAISRPQWAGL